MSFRLAVSLFLSLAVFGAASFGATSVVSLDGNDWRLATDPKNVGVAEKWFEAPRPEAKDTNVPGMIQIAFPGYAGRPGIGATL